MRYSLVLLCSLVVFSGCGSSYHGIPVKPQSGAGADEGFIEYCKTHDCREDVKVHLKKEDGSYFDFEKELVPPIVQGELVTILAGETIYIAFEPGENGPENLRAVESADHSPNTLTFTFSQEPTLPGGIGMMLRIDNSSQQHVKYDLGMQSIYSSEVFETSSCSLPGGLSGYESWQHPIFQLVMTNFRWVDGTNIDCY